MEEYNILSAQDAALITVKNKKSPDYIIGQAIKTAAARGESSALLFTSLVGILDDKLIEYLKSKKYTVQFIIDFYVISWGCVDLGLNLNNEEAVKETNQNS